MVSKYKNIHIPNSKKTKSEHRHIWESVNGEIPENHIIHHIDGNKNNNDISNLQLLTQKEHYEIHSLNTENANKIVKNTNKTIALTFSIDEYNFIVKNYIVEIGNTGQIKSISKYIKSLINKSLNNSL